MATKKRAKLMSLEDLARMTQAGFLGVGRRIDKLEKNVGTLERRTSEGFRGVLELLDAMRTDVNYIKHSIKNLPLLERDVEDLKSRLVLVEKRVGLHR
jgi:hypothetical protein